MIGGIAGRLNHNGVIVEEGEVNKMLSLLGPTEAERNALNVENGLAMGQMSLGIDQDFDNDNAPLMDKESGLAVAANACILNRDELIDAIFGESEGKANISDSALIMKAYEKWGVSCPERLSGYFAFVIWDVRNERLFCARDHMGYYSFCYHLSNLGFIFASEVKAVLAADGMKAITNPLYMADFILALQCDSESTAFEGVNHLPAAHAMTIEGDKCTKWQYWQPSEAPELNYNNKKDYVGVFGELISKLISCHITGNEKVGLQMGGGLQTAAITSTAAPLIKAQGKRLFGVSYVLRPGYEGILRDEQEHTDALAKFHDMDLKYVWQGPSFPHPFGPDVEDRFYFLDSPEANAFGHDHYAVYGAMKENGVKVMLSPGGVLFGRLPLTIKERIGQEHTGLKSITKEMLNTFLSDSQHNKLIRMRGHSDIGERVDLFNQDLKRDLDLTERVWANLDKLPGRRRPRASFRDNLVLAVEEYMGNRNKYISHKERVYGYSFRNIFMDKRLIDFAVGIASRPKIWGGDFRNLMRESFREIAPEKILNRKGRTSYPVDISERKTGAKEKILQSLEQIKSDDDLWNYLDKEKVERYTEAVSPHLDDYNKWSTQPPYIVVRIIMLQRFLPMVRNGSFERPAGDYFEKIENMGAVAVRDWK